MALTKTSETTIPAGQFEGMDDGGDTAVADRPTEASQAAQPTAASAAQDAQASAQRTVVERAKTAVATSGVFARGCRWDALQDVLGIDMLESLGIGAFPRITVDTGGFNRDKTNFLGQQIEFDLQSWNFVWLVTTGEQNNKEADKLIRTSYDGENLLNGEGTIKDYVSQLKADGYTKTSVKKYVEMYGMLTARTENGKRTEISPAERKLAQISISPQSVSRWAPFILESRMRKNMGVEDGPVLVLDSERKTLNSNTFGVVVFSARPMA